ncbi:MAG: hypothetical protein IJ088_13265 [Clostridia bacterium]|nr:hypothetical protein [Clostridia bacterium]
MGRGKHSRIERRRGGCLSGCLTRILVLLGLAALLFVGACMTGVITNDEQTGEPKISFSNVHAPDLSGVQLDFSSLGTTAQGVLSHLPSFRYKFGVKGEGLTVKLLHAGDGECIFVVSDGYVLVGDAGSGSGNWISLQMLLGGVRHINALAALSSDDTNIGGMKTLLTRYKPQYLLYQDSQVKGKAYNAMVQAADSLTGLNRLTARRGLGFQLGRATVSVLGPLTTYHSDSMDDGLTLRIDYGRTRVLLLGTVHAGGASDLTRLGSELTADVLVAGSGGAGLTNALLEAVRPRYVLVAGVPDEAAVSRARTWGANVMTVHDKGVLGVYTDGETLTLE